MDDEPSPSRRGEGTAGHDELLGHEAWLVPGRARIRWGRTLIAAVVGFVVLASPWVLGARPEGHGPWPYVLTVVALTCVAPLAAVAWSSVTRPHPHDRTVGALSRGLAATERRAVTTALRQGRPDRIRPEHLAYAQAWTARQGHGLVAVGYVPALVWSQALNAAGRGTGSAFVWFTLAGAIGCTVAAAVAVLLQRRRERSLRRLR